MALGLAVFALTIGPWFWGTDWHVYGDEGRQTTSAQEAEALKCAPLVSTHGVLDSYPGEIDIEVRGSAARAHRVADCLRHSPGIVDASTVRSQ
jgi:hypothetical protein